jgi:hypothetical protein
VATGFREKDDARTRGSSIVPKGSHRLSEKDDARTRGESIVLDLISSTML